MLTKNIYSVKEMFMWTRWETTFFLLFALVINVIVDVFGYSFLYLPWTPVALIGTAVAFMVGFQNNAPYGRIWEARKIWGGIVNASRTWGMKKDMVSNEYCMDKVSENELKAIKKRFSL